MLSVHPVLDPARLSRLTEESARELIRQGQSANTRGSYQGAMRYWAAWFAARYGQELKLPVPVPVVVQFIVDHAEREQVLEDADEDAAAAPAGKKARRKVAALKKAPLVFDLPPEVDQLLVAHGYKKSWAPMRRTPSCTGSPSCPRPTRTSTSTTCATTPRFAS
ncbi:hypothetical protein [Variovorax sp. RA8]|uniref:hypothetical protein n=1 Tax=Variovorax sp. (strain JCM 16519 / RA8) TaxID=662548 RepID=UPI000AB3A441|nr:hypothetical protein [Variovorax sp. RA8]